MRINEDYLDKELDIISNETGIEDDVNRLIRPGRWHNCIFFQLNNNSLKRQFRLYYQMLNIILGRYLSDYKICVIPWKEAVQMDNVEFSFKISDGKNGYTTDDTDIVFIQFNGTSEEISNMFVLRLFTFFDISFKFNSPYRNFGSLSVRLCRLRGDNQYEKPETFGERLSPRYRQLVNHFYFRMGEAMQIVSMLSIEPLSLKRSSKKKEEIADFLDFIRLTFDCDIKENNGKTFVDSYISKFQKKK